MSAIDEPPVLGNQVIRRLARGDIATWLHDQHDKHDQRPQTRYPSPQETEDQLGQMETGKPSGIPPRHRPHTKRRDTLIGRPETLRVPHRVWPIPCLGR
jgi:hypothetical protein